MGLDGSPEEKGGCCQGHPGAGDHGCHMAGPPVCLGTQRGAWPAEHDCWGDALTLPLRLCTLKAMLGDMSRSSDSCSESFFFSLSMALLPLFALCGKRLHGHFHPGGQCYLFPLGPSPLSPTLDPQKTGTLPGRSAWHRASVSCCWPQGQDLA